MFFFAPILVLLLGTGPGLSRGERRSRGIIRREQQIPLYSGWWWGADPGGFPGKEAQIPVNGGAGAEPGGSPGERSRSRWIPSWITALQLIPPLCLHLPVHPFPRIPVDPKGQLQPV